MIQILFFIEFLRPNTSLIELFFMQRLIRFLCPEKYLESSMTHTNGAKWRVGDCYTV